jgi:multisubunit Na+/H+ antiporter MnhB subunit
MKKNKLTILFLFIFASFFIASFLIPEASADTIKSATLVNPLPYTSPTELVARFLRIALGLLGAASLVMFIFAGLTWMTARGKAPQITKGKDTMIWAVVGLLVVFGSYALLNFVFDIFSF